jgi:hypothetical protein
VTGRRSPARAGDPKTTQREWDASALPRARLVPIPLAKPILFNDTHPARSLGLSLPRRRAARIEPISSSLRPAASLTVVSSAAAQQSDKPQGLPSSPPLPAGRANARVRYPPPGAISLAALERRCQVANRWMLMANNSNSRGYAADAVPATSRHVRKAVSRAARY